MEDRESWYCFGCIFRLILRCNIWKLALSLHLLQENRNGLTDSHHVDLRIAPVIPPCDRYLPSGLLLWCWSIVNDLSEQATSVTAKRFKIHLELIRIAKWIRNEVGSKPLEHSTHPKTPLLPGEPSHIDGWAFGSARRTTSGMVRRPVLVSNDRWHTDSLKI